MILHFSEEKVCVLLTTLQKASKEKPQLNTQVLVSEPYRERDQLLPASGPSLFLL